MSTSTSTSASTQITDLSPGHDSHHGFCCVCGMVWPCSWARRHQVQPSPTVPVPRSAD